MGLVLIDYHDPIGTITFNNTAKRNCVSNYLLKQLVGAMAEMKSLKARAVIIRAEKGAKVW